MSTRSIINISHQYNKMGVIHHLNISTFSWCPCIQTESLEYVGRKVQIENENWGYQSFH